MQIELSLAETYPSPSAASPSLLEVPPTIPPSSPASTTVTPLPGIFPLLLASLNEVPYLLLRYQCIAPNNNQSTTRGNSTVNKVTLDLACKLLDLPEYTIAPSELSSADIELLLDFLLHVRFAFLFFAANLRNIYLFSYSETAVTCQTWASEMQVGKLGS